ncbi:MAG: hypothetical protein IPN94_27890 [Sphingobacteriales bacterium]|nr:hypothetical protein [Sphingobacteriales bacterium]
MKIDCDEINQNLSTTGEIPPFEFNGIPTQYEDIDKTKITEFGYALLYNLHTPNFGTTRNTVDRCSTKFRNRSYS